MFFPENHVLMHECVYICIHMRACILFLQHLKDWGFVVGFFFQCCGDNSLVAVPYLIILNNEHMDQALSPL